MLKNGTLTRWQAEKATDDPGELLQLRHEAEQLLERLETSSAKSKQRLAENGQRDPMRSVTGRSALESAIASARSMIERMDTLLAEFDEVQEAAEADEQVARARQCERIGSAA